MPSYRLGRFLKVTLQTCAAKNFPHVDEGLACEDSVARTQIGMCGNFVDVVKLIMFGVFFSFTFYKQNKTMASFKIFYNIV